LYFVKDMKAGEIVTQEHVRSVRPGFGLAPKHYDFIIGRKISQAVTCGTAVTWTHFD